MLLQHRNRHEPPLDMRFRSAAPGSAAGPRRSPASTPARQLRDRLAQASHRRWPSRGAAQLPRIARAQGAPAGRAHQSPAAPRPKNAFSSNSAPHAATELQFRQQPGQPHRPKREIRDGAPHTFRPARLHVIQRPHEQPEKPLVRLGWRKQLLGHLREIIQRHPRLGNPTPARTASGPVRRNPGSPVPWFPAGSTTSCTCESRSSPAPNALLGRRARLATPRNFP